MRGIRMVLRYDSPTRRRQVGTNCGCKSCVLFSTKYGCGTRVGKAAESSAAQKWSLECRNRRSPCNLLVGSHFYLRLVRANLFWSSSSALSTIMCRKLHSLIEQTPRRRSTQKRLLAVASPSLVGSVRGIAAGMRCPRTRRVCSQSR